MSETLKRQKDVDWAENAPNHWDYVHLNILQDIRDELKALNRVMLCPNVGKGFRALAKIAARDERAFKRRVAAAAQKRAKRAAA